jgi:hypothetical protein
LDARPAGFEPATGGLEVRCGAFTTVPGCLGIPLSKPNSHIGYSSLFTTVCGGLVYRLVYTTSGREKSLAHGSELS